MLGEWGSRHLGVRDPLPADRRRGRDAAYFDDSRQIWTRLWCLPGCRRPTGEEAWNSFDLDHDLNGAIMMNINHNHKGHRNQSQMMMINN